jgi:hypothetical protein
LNLMSTFFFGKLLENRSFPSSFKFFGDWFIDSQHGNILTFLEGKSHWQSGNPLGL